MVADDTGKVGPPRHSVAHSYRCLNTLPWAALEEHYPTAWRTIAVGESGQDQPRRNGERGGEVVGRQPDEMSIVSRRGNEKDDHVSLIISSFHDDTSGDGLNIAQPRFGVDGSAPIRAADLRVPGTTIASESDRDFSPPSKTRIETAAEAAQQSDLRGIPDRLPGGKSADRDVESQRGTDHRKRLVRDSVALGQFDPADLRVRQPDEFRHATLRQAGRKARLAELVADQRQPATRLTPASVSPSIPGDHAAMIAIEPSLALTRRKRLPARRANGTA